MSEETLEQRVARLEALVKELTDQAIDRSLGTSECPTCGAVWYADELRQVLAGKGEEAK